jgi:hypothetical protein
LSAFAARDHVASLALARSVLERHRAELTSGEVAYVLQAGMLAAIASGDPQSALQLDAEYGATLSLESSAGNYRRWMLRLAKDELAVRAKAIASTRVH